MDYGRAEKNGHSFALNIAGSILEIRQAGVRGGPGALKDSGAGGTLQLELRNHPKKNGHNSALIHLEKVMKKEH